MTATIKPAQPDWEVTFVLVNGQRIDTRVEAITLQQKLQTVAVPRRSGETREEQSMMLLSLLASGFENDNPWTVNDTDGVSWLFRQGALLSIEIRDPMGIGSKPIGFTPPAAPPEVDRTLRSI